MLAVTVIWVVTAGAKTVTISTFRATSVTTSLCESPSPAAGPAVSRMMDPNPTDSSGSSDAHPRLLCASVTSRSATPSSKPSRIPLLAKSPSQRSKRTLMASKTGTPPPAPIPLRILLSSAWAPTV